MDGQVDARSGGGIDPARHPVSAMTVCRYLWAMEYSLQGDVKAWRASSIPIAISNSLPQPAREIVPAEWGSVISVDTRKRAD